MTHVLGMSYGKGRIQLVKCSVAKRQGLPRFIISDLIGKQPGERRDRLRMACKSVGVLWPAGRVTVEFSAVGSAKHGDLLDLAIVAVVLGVNAEPACYLGIVSATGGVTQAQELPGLLSYAARNEIAVVIPAEVKSLAESIPGLRYSLVHSVSDLLSSRTYTRSIGLATTISPPNSYDIDGLVGHVIPKRALLIALAGHHPALFWGPIGCGKTALIESTAQLLPARNAAELARAREIASAYGGVDPGARRPFLVPDSFTSINAIYAEYGLWERATDGILFLDELSVFERKVRDALRAPLQKALAKPWESPLVLAASNLCACGRLGTDQPCTCSALELQRYQAAISPALLDRFSLHIQVPWQPPDSVAKAQLTGQQVAETIKEFWYDKATSQPIQLSKNAEAFLNTAGKRLHLSARTLLSLQAVSSTIAQLEKEQVVLPIHVTEALQYRYRPN